MPSEVDRPPHPAAWYALPQPQFLGGNEAVLLRGGDELFPAVIAAIDAALHEVWFATYIFHDDAAAEGVARALVRAARRKVRVRVVVDGFGTHRALGHLQRWLAGSGVSMVVFRPVERWWNWLQPGQLRRLHTKLCVVDGTHGFVGGINVIDDRNDLNHGYGETPRLDFAVGLRGPVVAPIEQTVRAMWTRAAFGHDWRAEVLSMARSAEPLTQARRLLGRLRILPAAPPPAAGDQHPVRAAFLVRDNLRQRRSIERAYIDAIRGAAHSIDIVVPYFYPGRSFRRALVKAARRGVRVRLLLQGKLDYRFAGLAARVLYDELLAEGVQIHEYQPAFLHAKAAIVDETWATLGSSNIDPLSLLLNLEANVAILDEGFAAELARAFELALTQSIQVTVAPYQKGALAVLGRGFVAWVAHWYLRMAGLSGRY
ncbi:cardiolipin synthase ClsB [Ideonella sp.]|uniref:cardiolipin synthase ClsB n=1 Tax=Ideonella sp. TaxID=1929293 RepID=UPI002B4647A8|nr:cardiolipin synthase ClsB [Ideonella sp.]HJV68693.1 cardiolipin synthase ClsB [Ideonella sp.]